MSFRFGLSSVLFFVSSFAIELRSQPIYHFQRIDVDRGLRSNYVTTIAQDAQGFMWIGTYSGVQLFDMNEFVDRPSLNDFIQVFIDRADRKWLSNYTTVGIYNDSINKVNHLFFKDSSLYTAHYMNWMVQENNGTVWMNVNFIKQRGFCYYDEKAGYLSPYDSLLPKDSSVQSKDISDIQTIGENNLLLGTRQGLVYYNKSEKRFYHPDDPKYPLANFSDAAEPVYALYSNEQREILLLTWGPKKGGPYFYIMDTAGTVSNSYPIGEVRSIAVDDLKNIWLAGENLWMIDHHTKQIGLVQLPDDIRMINSITKDREGNLWLGTYHGVLVFNPNQPIADWNNQNEKGKTHNAETLAMNRTHDGIIIVGTWRGEGIYFYDEKLKPLRGIDGFTRKDFEHLRPIPIWSILESSDKSIWLGGQSGHLCRVNRKSRKIEHFNSATFRNQTIRDICEDSLHNIWLSTQRGLVFRRDASTGSISEIKFTNVNGNFVFFKRDHESLWLVYNRTIVKVDPTTLRWEKFDYGTRDPKISVLSNFTKILNIDRDQIVINATNGLVFFHVNTKAFTFNRLFKTIISGEFVGDSKYLIASADGVLAEFHNNVLRVLQKGNVFSVNASIRLPNSQFAFGNETGFTIVKYPVTAQTPSLRPLRITSVRAQNSQKNVDSVLSNGLTLESNQNYFSVSYSALQFHEKDNIIYFYRINKKTDFIDHGHNRSISFAELSPGKHELELSYSVAGIRSPVVSLKIEIIPPFWKTLWFLLICLAVAACIVVLIYRIQLGKVLALVRVREKLSRDLHDEMGSNLSTINILSNVIMDRLRKISLPEKDVQIIDKISDLSSQAIGAMDEIVWSLNLSNDSMEEIIKRMRVMGSHLEDLNVNFSFQVEGSINKIKIDPEVKNHFYLIYKEIITNIKKHSHCKNVWSNLKFTDNLMELTVTDDGVGFDPQKNQQGNGLRNIQNRADKINGHLTLKTQPGRGTTTTIRIPVK